MAEEEVRAVRRAAKDALHLQSEVRRLEKDLADAGELGWKLHRAMADQKCLFSTLMDTGRDQGLVLVGGRTTGMLRPEKRYRSWAPNSPPTPLSHVAGIERFCVAGKEYVGHQAIDAERTKAPPRRLVTLEVAPQSPPCWGTELVLRNGNLIGFVTSCGMGWRTGRMLAVCWIEAVGISPGCTVRVETPGKSYDAKVLTDPVYDPKNRLLMG